MKLLYEFGFECSSKIGDDIIFDKPGMRGRLSRITFTKKETCDFGESWKAYLIELSSKIKEHGFNVDVQILDLKECPICGGEAKFSTSRSDANGPGTSSVQCTACGLKTGRPSISRAPVSGLGGYALVISRHDNEVITLWNRRK